MRQDFSKLTVGSLALQGDFERHVYQLHLLGVKAIEIRTPEQLKKTDALIIPGGESTTIDILLDRFNLRDSLLEYGKKKPVWGTCAGMIMVAKEIDDNQAGVKPLELININVVRNGYGRQLYSFEEKLDARLGEKEVRLNAAFIRAPRITRMGEQVTPLAVYNDSPVLVEQDNILASSFHTELDDDTTLVAYFLQKFLLS